MFDYLDIMTFGREIEAHGEKWLELKALQNRCYLAIRPSDSMPCQVFLVQTPEEEKKIDAQRQN